MRKELLYVVLCIMQVAPMAAQDTLVISDQTDEYVLSQRYVHIYKDSSRMLSARDVFGKKFELLYVDTKSGNFSTSNYWIKFTVKNQSSSPKWLLELLDFTIDEVAFYDARNDLYIETGYAKPFTSRSYKHKNYCFDLSLSPGKTATYLLKVSSSLGFGPTLKVRSANHFLSYSNNEYLLLGFYYGLLILFASYNFFLFITLRDKAYLFYVLYVISIGFRSLQWDGLAFQYLWPSYPIFNKWLDFAPELLLLAFAAYAIHFLELRKNHNVYYNVILASLCIYFVLFTLNLFYVVEYLRLVYFILFFIIYGTSVQVYRGGYLPARFFVLGYSLLIISQFLYFLISRGLKLENPVLILLFIYSLQIGFVIEAFVFSMAMADKVKIFKIDKETAQQLTIEQLKINEELKDKVNKELEAKVAERTMELEIAKVKLLEQAEKINHMNSQLDLENHRLKSNVKEINIERGLLKSLSIDEFTKAFPDESACYRFIQDIKWKDGFICHKCGSCNFVMVGDPFSRRCIKCRYIETIKANTIFHNLKFPIEKAFQMIYLILSSEKEVSTYELARKMDLQQRTCWAFRQKVMDTISTKNITKKDIMEQGWGILINDKDVKNI